MNILKKKNIILLITLLLIGSLMIIKLKTNNQTQTEPIEDVVEEINAEGIVEISKYGNVKINLEHSKVLDAFEYGDILTISFNDVSIDAPLCIFFSDVDAGYPGLFLQMDGETEETELAINMGNFAQAYGIAEKLVYEDKNYEWQYYEGMSDKIIFNIKLKQKAGYLEEFTIRNMTYTDLREDYKELSDEEYANFRKVSSGQIKDGVLYRSSSMVNPEHKRNNYADDLAKQANIDVFIDLADSNTTLQQHEGVNDSYFISQKYIAVALIMDFASKENTDKLAEALRFMIENPGTYCIFCDEGKTRTGFVVALLEGLMGASYDEIADDFMQSFINYYKINKDDPEYDMLLNGNLNKAIKNVLGIDPMKDNMQEASIKYLLSIGLSEEEITKLKENLIG